MDSLFGLNSALVTWVLIPLLIFLARICDVSLGTIRLIFVSRGMRYLAPLVGFFEVLIWLMAIGEIFRNLRNPVCYIAYAGGFAMGNYIGMVIVDKLSLGKVLVRIITRRDAGHLLDYLKSRRFGVTSVDAEGVDGPVRVIFTIVQRSDLAGVVDIVKEFNPNAFYTVEDMRFVSEGIFPERRSRLRLIDFPRGERKSK